MSDIAISDRFVKLSEFEAIYHGLLDSYFPWNASKIVDDSKDNKHRNLQMTHMFYERHTPDESCKLLYPILQKLQPCAIIKIKANLIMGTDTLVEHGMHIDILDAEDRDYLKTSIYYMNTCDGYTLFEDGTKVESIANRLVTFPNGMKHTGTSTTNASFRMVINFNYV